MRTNPHASGAPLRRGQAGFTILEALIGGSILAIALLGHTASLFSEHRLSRDERMRSTALQAVEQFLERLRADDDWAGLYGYLRSVPSQPSLPGGTVKLTDGRRAFAPQAYYADYVTPADLLTLHVRVDVPAAPPKDDALAPPVLREDSSAPVYGLPYDLNGDGVIDDESHGADYRCLPLVITFVWTHSGQAPEEMRVPLWLWGSR